MRSLVPYIVRLGLAGVLIAACQAPDEYFWGPDAGLGLDGPPLAGRGGNVTGTGGIPTGTGGIGPTGLGGTTGVAGSVGTAGTTGTGGSPVGAGGTPAGAAGTTGTAGSAAGRGGTTGAAGSGGATAGRGGTTGAGGAAGTTTGRGGTTGTAGTTGTGGAATGRGGTTGTGGAAGTTTTGRGGTTGTGGAAGTTTGRGGTTGTAGTTGTGTVVYSEDFESDAVGATGASGWTRTGGSSGDWAIAMDGTRVLQQDGNDSSTLRTQNPTSASGAPWSGATSASARVKILATGSSNQAALVCVRFMDGSNRYCGALTPTGVQIQTAVGGSAGSSAVFATTVTTGTFYDLRVSVDASNTLTVYLNGTQRGTYTPAALASGTVAIGTASILAAFDNVTVTRP